MRPSQVRSAILGEHEEIRAILGAVDALAGTPQVGPKEVEALRQQSLVLHRRLIAHLEFEDRHLVPAVRDADAWGEERARRLVEEHAEQRELLEYILMQLGDRERAPQLLCRTLRTFVELVNEDMVHEESALLRDDILRDDVVAINLEAG